MINHIMTFLFNHENMLIKVLSLKLHIKLFKLTKLKMSLSLFCAIPNSNMTNTLSHTHKITFWIKQHLCIQKVSGLGEERCRLCRARMQKTLYVCVLHSPGWACRDSRHREQAAEGFPIIPCSPYIHTEDHPPPPRLTILAKRLKTKKKPLWYIFWLTVQTQHPWQTRLYQSRTT